MKLLPSFEQNIIKTFGKNGIDWLSRLHHVLSILKEKWLLSVIQPIPNMTYHYVAKAIQASNTPVVVKIGCDKKLMFNEITLLKHFDGVGAIRVLDFQEEYNALLLEQAIPGHSLKAFYPKKLASVMKTYANVMHKIHGHTLKNQKQFPSIAQWLEALDRVDSSLISNQTLYLAKAKRDSLIETMSATRLLHGDLHLDNILENRGEWICIDPQGVIGEPSFEAASFDIFAPQEIKTASSSLFLERIRKLAKVANFHPERLESWFYVRLVLSAVWSIEDGQDPSKALKLAALLNI